MSALDDLYGEGTNDKFLVALPGEPEVLQGTNPDKSVGLQARWKDSSLLSIACFPDYVHYVQLDSEREGLYSSLCETLPQLFKSLGVKYFTASPGSEESKDILMRRGDWKETPQGLRWKL